MGLWQLIMISMQLGLSIIYTGHKKLIKFYRFLFLGISILSIFFGVGVIVRRFYIHFCQTDFRFDKDVAEFFRWEEYLAESIFALIGLVANFLMMMLFNNYGWLTHQTNKETMEIKNLWNFQVYTEWIFYSLFISVFLDLVTILANFFIMIQISSFVMGDAFRSTGCGIVMILYGIFACKNCVMNKLDFDDNIDEKPTEKSLALLLNKSSKS